MRRCEAMESLEARTLLDLPPCEAWPTAAAPQISAFPSAYGTMSGYDRFAGAPVAQLDRASPS
jgi:hypothetical protein